ncbi:ASPM protein, partial [Atractosteus spatula]|nr:ASPM protein [Atractosteus spatula]
MSGFVKKGVLLDFSPTCSVHNEINPGKGAAVTNFSSGDANKENKSGSYPVLSLVQFSRAPFVSFETVKLGSSKGAVLVVENPNQDVAEVKIDKFPSAKGFSVDHRHFILKPEESTSLSITWTPVEEGGVRELITFIANGIVKHQAILLGRAEASKKKRKSLWDSIKTKRPSECPVPAKGRKTDSSLKKSANKTFHVSRKVQYVKEKGRSPLSSYSLSEKESYYTPGSLQKSKTRSALDKSKSNDSFLDDKSVPIPRPTFLVSDFDHVESSDHIETRTFECSSVVPSTSDARVVSVLNRTHSPVYTPDRVVNPLTPRINSRHAPDSFLREDAPDGGLKFSPVTPILSVQDALAIIQSDVTHGCEEGDVLPAMCSSFDFSDSLDLLTDTEGFLSSSETAPSAIQPTLPVLLDSPDHQSKKRKSDEFSKDNLCETFQVKRSRSFRPATEKNKSVQERRPSSRTSQTTRHSHSTVSTKSLNVAQSQLIFSKPVKKAKILNIKPNATVHCANCTAIKELPLNSEISSTPVSCFLPGLVLNSLHYCETLDCCEVHTCYNVGLKCTLRSSVKTSLKTTKSVAGVAQSQLTFIKPVQTAIPRHPLPFAAKNMFYDERWIEKQERGFTWWVNYVLTPDDFKVNTEVSKVSAMSLVMGVENQHKVSVPKAPTKEEMSFKAYTARCRLNRLRRAACRLFTSESMVKAIQRLELEIEAKRLLVRKDRHLWKDIGERQKVLNWLLSYNPLWLRIGLEVIYGELISLESNSDVMGLAMFILNRLLWNPDIGAEYRHPKVPHLYRDVGHEEALSRFTLKKLLLLVCFLDKAKESRIIEHDPCLFCMDAEFKSSKDLLLAFSRDFLSGEGILSRHLGFLGLPVSHVQTPLDEFSFAVKKLSVDLRCGIRLVRVMELFTQDWSLSRKLRVPAISRLQKIHNVDVALQVLKARGVDLNDEHGATIDSRDIVDGHREKTLTLLWTIIFAFQVDILLDETQLEEEIGFLKRAWRTRQKLAALQSNHGLVEKTKNESNNSLKGSRKMNLLMDWVNAVCIFYDAKVENFTVSFSDGRVLCYLIHHYHPCYLPLSAVSKSTTQTVECGQRGTVGLNSSTSDSESSFDVWPESQNGTSTSMLFKELLEKERKNFQLVNTAVSSLGGVPAMIDPADMSNTIPNEKVCLLLNSTLPFLGFSELYRYFEFIDLIFVLFLREPKYYYVVLFQVVVCYLSFLCARLLDLRKETRAARVIQEAWRKFRLQMELKLYEAKNKAALKIQSAVLRFLQRRRNERKNMAALLIQTSWRGYIARQKVREMKREQLHILQNSAAATLQAHWRRYSAVKKFQRFKCCTIVIQAYARMKRAFVAYQNVLSAAKTIQKHWKARQLERAERQKYLTLRRSVVIIQRGFRRWKARALKKMNSAAAVIQAAFRSWQKRKAERRNRAAVKIQSWYRMCKYQKRYFDIQQKMIKIQAWYRVIQSFYRGMKARWHVKEIKAAIVIQSFWRMKSERRTFLNAKQSAVILQSCLRRWNAWKRYQKMKRSAIVIQNRYRAYVSGRKVQAEYNRIRSAVISLQSAYRKWQDRRKAQMHRSVVKIQAWYRGYSARKKFRMVKEATIKIQSYIKMVQATLQIQMLYRANKLCHLERTEYQRKRDACICLQAAVRGHLQRKRLDAWRKSATKIQSFFRMYKTRSLYLKMCSATVIIQKRFRVYRERVRCRHQFLEFKAATICLQAAYRGYSLRKMIKYQNKSATIIQTAVRAHIHRRRFVEMRQASAVIQRWFRACKERQKIRETYLNMQRAALTLQAAYRGHRVRKQMLKHHQAATVIQAAFRMFVIRKDFLRLKQAAVPVQKRFRAKIAGQNQKQKYQNLRQSVVRLQALWRGQTVRKQMRKWHDAAVAIQSLYRTHVAQSMYRSKKRAALVLQRQYRAYCLGKKQHYQNIEVKKYRAKKNAAVVIQSAFRGFKSRRQVMEMHKAATVIQRTFKTYCERRRFLSLKAASVVIQQKYRATVAAKTDRKVYLMHRCAIVALQSAYRGMKDRRTIRKMHQAATVIQAVFRMHRARIPFQAMKLAATLIQKYYRAYVNGKNERQAFIKLRNSAVLIQAAYRGMKERRQQLVKDMHKAASIIQSSFKAYRERKRYLSVKSSVLAVQQRYRATVAAKRQKEHYSSLRHATLTIQAAYRGFRTRKEIRQKHLAATVIQATFRSHRETVKFQAMKMSSLIIQKHYKAYIQGRKDRVKYLKLRLAVVTIQAMFRGKRVRQNVAEMQKAASTIQASFRMYRQRMAFKRMRWAASVLQQRFRAHRVRNSEMLRYQSIWKAVVCIQAAFRAQRARKLVKQVRAARKIQSVLKMFLKRRHFLKQKAASVVIQSVYRSYRARVSYTAMRVSAVVIQRWYRSCRDALKQQAKYHAMKQAALTLQVTSGSPAAAYTSIAFYRGFVQRLVFLQYKTSATKIQRYYRARILQKTERAKFLELKKSAIALQAVIRGYLARQLAMKMRAARTIQAWYKGVLVRRDLLATKKAVATVHRCIQTRQIRNRYLKICQSVHIIQKRWRETLYARKEHHNFLKMKSSSIKIQAVWKGYCTRKKLLRVQHFFFKLKQYLLLQGYKVKMEPQMKRASITLQAFCRGWLVRKRIAEEKEVKRRLRFSAAVYHHHCAMKIQRRLRAYLALKSAKQQMHSVISLQRWIRSKLQRKRYLEEREKIIKVQRAVRAWLHRRNEAATVIQQAVKRFVFKRRQQRAQRGIIKFQALWRGFRSRKKSDTSEIVAMRCRFESVNQGVREEDKLWNKTTIAIDYLLKYKHFSYILAALKHLETATRLSSKCCEHLVNSGATLTIFTLIRSCNRSVPCMEVITYAVQVLLNLSKYDKTTDAVYDVDHSIDTLLDLLQIYRDKAGDKVADKGGSIFAKTCFLLVILLQNTQRAVEVRNLPKAVDRICSIYRLTARKHKMDAARTLTRQKMNVSLNGSFFSQTTPHKTKAIPRIAPDWVLRKDNMKEVVDPLQAIQMLADALAVVP